MGLALVASMRLWLAGVVSPTRDRPRKVASCSSTS
jgi:hypothetical protein